MVKPQSNQRNAVPSHARISNDLRRRAVPLAGIAVMAMLAVVVPSGAQTTAPKAVACASSPLGACTLDPAGVSVEYRHKSGVHFTTACTNEQTFLEQNTQVKADFVRTGQTLQLLPNPLAGVTLPINRYFITLGGVARHFYTLLPGELYALNVAWEKSNPSEACFESALVGHAVPPAGITTTTGMPPVDEIAAAACPRGTYPLWRAFNKKTNAAGATVLPQHRFTSDWTQLQTILATTGASDEWDNEGVRLCGRGPDQQIKLVINPPSPPSATESRWTISFTAQHDGKAGDTPPAQSLVPTVAFRLPVGFNYQTATTTNAAASCTPSTPNAFGQEVRCTLSTLTPGSQSPTYTLWATGPATATGTTRVPAIAIGTASANLNVEEAARLAPAQCVASGKPAYGCGVAEYVAPAIASIANLKISTPVITNTVAQAGSTSITLTSALKNENAAGSAPLKIGLSIEYQTASGAWAPVTGSLWSAPTSNTLTSFGAGSNQDINVTVGYPSTHPRPAQLRVCASSNTFNPVCTGNVTLDLASQSISTSNLPTNDLPPALSISGFNGPATLAVGASYPAFSYTVTNASGVGAATGLTCRADTYPSPGILASPSCSMTNTSLAGGQATTCQCGASGTTLINASAFSHWLLSVSSASGAAASSLESVSSQSNNPPPPPPSTASLEPVRWDSASASSNGAQPSGVRTISFNGTLSNTSASAVPVALKVQVLQAGTWTEMSANWSQPNNSPTNYSLTGSTTVSGSFDFNPGTENSVSLRLCAVKPNTLAFGNNGGSCGDSTDVTRKLSDPQVITFTPPPAVTVALTQPSPGLLLGQASSLVATVTAQSGNSIIGPLYLMVEAPNAYTLSTSDGSCFALSTRLTRCQILASNETLASGGSAQRLINLTPNVGSGGVVATLYASATALGTLTTAQCSGTVACTLQALTSAYYDLRATINGVQAAAVSVSGTTDAVSSNFTLNCDNVGNAATPANARCVVTAKNTAGAISSADLPWNQSTVVYLKNTGAGALALCKAQNTSGTVCDPVISALTPQTISAIDLVAYDGNSPSNDNYTPNNTAIASVAVGSATPPPGPTTCTADPNASRLRLYQQGQTDPYRYDDITLESNKTYYLEIEPGTQANFRRYLEIKTITGSYSPIFSISKCPGDLSRGTDTPYVLVGGDAGYIANTVGPPGIGAEFELPGIASNTRWYINYNTRQCYSSRCSIAYVFSW